MRSIKWFTHSANYEVEWPSCANVSGRYEWVVDYNTNDDVLSGAGLSRNLALEVAVKAITDVVGVDCADEAVLERELTRVADDTYVIGRLCITLTDITTS